MWQRFLAAVFWMELIARIIGPPDHGPYLIGFTAAEPMPDFEAALYHAMGDADEV